MKLLSTFSIFLLAGFTAAAPASDGDDEIITVTRDFFPASLVKYTSKHDIVNILVPVNSLNFDENESSSSEDADVIFFFVEADIDKKGQRSYKGLYVFKDGKATKILENGRDAAASSDNSKQVFFAADDGLYEYKADTNEAVKYGTVTDDLIGIAKTNDSDIIYILTKDNELYKVTEKGTTKTKVEEVVNAQQIVLDYQNNLYFYAEDKKPYVLTADGLKSITGLPANPTDVNLVKPPFVIEDGVPFIVNNVAYIIYANGTSEKTDFDFQPDAKPSAYGMEAALIQYYAFDKKIYEYNVLLMVMGEIMEELKNFFESKASDIQTLASKKRINKVSA